MQRHKKLSARILSMALSVAMVATMMPSTVFAAEGDVPLGASSLGASSVGTIQSFEKLEDRFVPSTGAGASKDVYALNVELNTPVEDLNLPDELTAMVARTTTVSKPAEDEPVVDSGKPSEPAEDEAVPDEDEVVDEDTSTDETVSGNQPASPSDAQKEEIKDDDVPLAPERSQDEETATTIVEQQAIPVTWNSDKEYKSDENGKFIYTAVLTEDYILADGVELPQIYVMVGKQARATASNVCEISGTGYTTLKDAFVAATDGQTVKVTADHSFTEFYEVVISGSKNVTLDLNNHTVTSTNGANADAYLIKDSASLTVVGPGTLTSTGRLIDVMDSGTITIEGGTLTANGGSAISCKSDSAGKIRISGGTLSTTNSNTYALVQNSGSGDIVMTGGTIETAGNIAINVSAAGGPITISGGKVTASNSQGAAIAHFGKGKVTISETAEITGSCAPTANFGTITIFALPSTPATVLEIKDTAKVCNSATPEGYSVYFHPTEVTTANISSYYSQGETATVGLIKPSGPSITIGAQTGAINYGTSGTATFAVTGKSFDASSFAPSVQWKSGTSWGTTAPTGITGTLSGSGDNRTLTVSTTATVNAGEYEFKIVSGDVESTGKVKIDKAEYPSKTQNFSVKSDTANAAATASLPEIPGAAYGAVTVKTNSGDLISGTPTVSGTTLTMNVASKADGTTAVLEILVTNATNYKNFTMTVNITAKNKTAASITAGVDNKTYNGVAVSQPNPTAVEQGTSTPVTLTYTYKWQKRNESGVYTDISGNTAPKDAGSYKLVIEGSSDTHAGTTEIAFTISKATVTITADNKSAYVGDAKPALTYTATGIASGETLTTEPTLEYESEPDMSKAGSVKIKAKDAVAPNMDNYESAITYVDGTLTISNKSSGGGGGGGSSSSGSSTTPPTKTEPVSGTSNTTATMDKNGNATTTVTDKNIADAVQAAKDAASKKGVNAGEVTAVINVTSPANSNPNTVTVNLPKTVQQQVINNKIDNVAIVIDKPDISIGMNLTTITEMNKQANADIQLSATRTDATKLSTEAKNTIGNRPAFDLKATYNGGAKSITSFGTGTVSVAIPYTLQKGEVAGGLYAVYVDGNGKVTHLTNSSYDAENNVLRFSTNHFSVYGIGYKAPVGLTDIANHWAKTDIEFVVGRGLMTGTSNTTFAPNGSMTRGMFVTALGRLAGVDVNSYKTSKFTDVKADAYYAPYVNWAAEKGITNGTTATTFSPDNTVTRQEMAAFMSNYAKAMGYTVPETRAAVTFADNGSIGSWAAVAVKQMQMSGVLNGKNGNKFDPTGTATRAEVAAVLHRYVELVIDRTTTEGWTTNDSGSGMYYQSGKAVTGTKTISGVAYTFNTYGETTRKTTTAGAATDAALPVDSKKTGTYTVQKGDSFWLIAKKVGCTMAELEQLNGKSRYDTIYAGQTLKVPQK